jgi:malonate decarboxylase epsilon subunit
MKIVFTFPGRARSTKVCCITCRERNWLRREVLGTEVDTLDSADALSHTRAVQLCLLIAAWPARELERRGVAPDIVSGLSIGAYPAAVIAGALDFER